MAGIDARTGRVLGGWGHLLQSAGKIFTTMFGQRVMRGWFGSFVPALLGELAVQSVVLRFYTAIYIAFEMWEPRFTVERISFEGTAEEVRQGRGRFAATGTWRPRAHLGDMTPAGRRTISAERSADGLKVMA